MAGKIAACMDTSQPFEVPSGRVARGRVAAPPSKSHAIRALACAALAEGTSTLHGLSRCDADDIVKTAGALRTLGFVIDGDRVTGAGGRIPNPRVTLDLGGSGTALRFLTAVAALGTGPTTLTGDATLRRRPIGAVVTALRDMGVTVETSAGATAPLVVSAGPPSRFEARVDASRSSHAVSALLLIAPMLAERLHLETSGELASRPYVDLTLATMAAFGVNADGSAFNQPIRVPPDGYRRTSDLRIDGDWSSACYVAAAAAVTEGEVEIEGLHRNSHQADERIVDLIGAFGVEVVDDSDATTILGAGDRRPLDVDLRDSPDLAPLVGALGCVASGTTRVRGAAHLRLKESDRIATVVAAARALGCAARELPDGFEIDGPARHGGRIETHHDHRIAMAFAVAGLAVPGVVIDDPACVAKSYPAFWDDLATLIA
jgi:3-phosphoshikimate 1-carboxyvinyltransferase